MLVVTTPEPTAITDAYAVIKVITAADESPETTADQPAGQPGRATPNEARVVHERIAKVARQFLGVSVLDAGYVPADEQVPLAVRKRTPFVLGGAPVPRESVRWQHSPCGSSRAWPRSMDAGGLLPPHEPVVQAVRSDPCRDDSPSPWHCSSSRSASSCGMAAENRSPTTVARALVAMVVTLVVGLVVGAMGQKMLEENLSPP